MVSRAASSKAIGFFYLNMAQDKKGFILYADQKELFDQLPNDKAGELIKHVFSYVNDENPQTDDLLLKLAFTPIKQQLKRDLKKFEAAKKQRSEAGKRSAFLRKQQLEPTKSTSVESRSTKSTVTVNDNVTVNDTVNDNDDELYRSIDTLAEIYLKNEDILEAVMAHKDFPLKSKTQVEKKMAEFVLHLRGRGETTKQRLDFNGHFRSWVILQAKGEKIETTVEIN